MCALIQQASLALYPQMRTPWPVICCQDAHQNCLWKFKGRSGYTDKYKAAPAAHLANCPQSRNLLSMPLQCRSRPDFMSRCLMAQQDRDIFHFRNWQGNCEATTVSLRYSAIKLTAQAFRTLINAENTALKSAGAEHSRSSCLSLQIWPVLQREHTRLAQGNPKW